MYIDNHLVEESKLTDKHEHTGTTCSDGTCKHSASHLEDGVSSAISSISIAHVVCMVIPINFQCKRELKTKTANCYTSFPLNKKLTTPYTTYMCPKWMV
jgi:hypothetical protein